MSQPLLISFLGKSNADPQKGYRTATYRIGNEIYQTAYLGFALAKYLQPTKIVLLGTAGSMWDVLIEAHATGNEAEEARLHLMELAQQNAVTESVLHKFAPLIEQHLGLPVDLRIIPYARDTTEQVAIISSIANATLPKQTVILDVTHGFRHLPMLGLVAAHYLERVRQVNVRNLYYGALEMTEHGETPVLDLRGLLQTMDWIQAFAAYDASGNYAHFAPLLANENWSEADCKTLNEAAFFERTTNIVKTREKLSSLKTALGERNSTFLRLFGDELQKRLSWWKLPNRADWESQLGNAYFEKADYLRASIFIQEACLSKAMPVEEQHEYNERRETLRKTMQKTDGRFARLTDLRNGMAHGVKGFRQASSKVLKNESTLRTTLGDFVKNWQTLGKTSQ